MAVLARHDLKILGKVHRATISGGAILVFVHSTVSLAAMVPPVIRFANLIGFA